MLLSGAETELVAGTRALVAGPEVLLLAELTADVTPLYIESGGGTGKDNL